MGVLQGALIKFRVDAKVGESVNDDSGAILPVNTNQFFPLTSPTNESVISITELNYTQLLSEKFGLTIGKYQTLDGDPNEFAGGRGRTQFMNMNFIASGVIALTVPYSTLGGGAIWMPTDKITVTSLLVSTTDSSTNAGFTSLDDGWTWSTEADFQYKLGSLPGGFNVGAVYAFDGDFSQINGKLELIPGQGVTLPKKSDTWSFYASGWQYIFTMDNPKDKINLTDGKPDLRGVGLFARFGFADKDTNPVDWSLSGGVGARGLIPSRDNDTMGVAYCYTALSTTGRLQALLLEDSVQAFEAFYNIAITPAVGLTFDAQWVEGASKTLDAATVVGARIDVRF